MGVTKALGVAEKGCSFDIIEKSGLFPSLEILNTFFACGIDDVASGVSFHWQPFRLTQIEYETFYAELQRTFGELRIDALGFDRYQDWFSGAVGRSSSD